MLCSFIHSLDVLSLKKNSELSFALLSTVRKHSCAISSLVEDLTGFGNMTSTACHLAVLFREVGKLGLYIMIIAGQQLILACVSEVVESIFCVIVCISYLQFHFMFAQLSVIG